MWPRPSRASSVRCSSWIGGGRRACYRLEAGAARDAPLLLVASLALSSLVLFGTSREGWSSAGIVGPRLVRGVRGHRDARGGASSLSRATPSGVRERRDGRRSLRGVPAILLDDSLARAATRPPLAVPLWEDAAFGGLPSGSLLLVSSPRLYARALATLVMGDLPGDIGVLPTFDAKNEASAIALSHDARLIPLFRDIALVGAPQELSLSTLAVTRPVVVTTDPGWDRTLTRHLIPGGLPFVFEPEPRGGANGGAPSRRPQRCERAWRQC